MTTGTHIGFAKNTWKRGYSGSIGEVAEKGVLTRCAWVRLLSMAKQLAPFGKSLLLQNPHSGLVGISGGGRLAAKCVAAKLGEGTSYWGITAIPVTVSTCNAAR